MFDGADQLTDRLFGDGPAVTSGAAGLPGGSSTSATLTVSARVASIVGVSSVSPSPSSPSVTRAVIE